MNDRFRFRAWYQPSWEEHRMLYDVEQTYDFLRGTPESVHADSFGEVLEDSNFVVMQCTGLRDKNGLNLLFECDIINMEGIKIGNCYENKYLLKDTTNFVIKGMGTKEWRNSEQEAIKRGCYYAE